MKGLFIMYKPKGPSSAGFLRSIQRELQTKEKIGHGGTLDPFADGVLVVGIGRDYTKQLDTILRGKDKSYRAHICIGASSDTDDITGVITKNIKVPSINTKDVEKELEYLKNQTQQIPPIYSAIKKGGVAAYKKAREGKKVSPQPRIVSLYEYTIESFKKNEDDTYTLVLDIVVSSGFYVRSLARDLGERLSSKGYLSSLTRTAIGDYKIERALSLEEFLSGPLELSARLEGVVQGVGMRRFIEKRAQQYNLKGFVKNNDDGSVSICAQGEKEAIQYFLPNVEKGPHSSIVKKCECSIGKIVSPHTTFSII